MRWRRSLLALALVGLAAPPAAADTCELQFISHGTFRQTDGCLLFEDDLGNFHEVVNPRGAWRDGMTGTIYSERAAPRCSSNDALRACRFEADFTRRVNGTLIIRNFIECPGYTIRAANQNYLILNCEDFGDALCNATNVGRHIQAQVFVDTGVSICLGQARSTVLEFKFLQ